MKFTKRIAAMAIAAATLGTSTAFNSAWNLGASAAGSDNYAKALQYSMYFYDANMCGSQVGETSAFGWRNDCHTGDAVPGGFHDAGDHVKFGLPAGYAASVLGLGYHEFGDAYDKTGQTAHLKTITDYFAKYFKDSTTLSGDSVSKFVYQIGDGDADHAEWCAPEKQSQASRKEFSTTDGASDIAAEYAAALAANYVNFGNAEDLKYAKALFNFSTKGNKKATEGVGGFYDSWDYYDDQAWAAGWLYLATKDNTYKTFLDTYCNTTGAGSSGQDGLKWGIYSTLSWNNVSMGAGILQAEITQNASDWEKVTKYLNEKGATSDKLWWESNSQWGSARYCASATLTALIAAKNNASGASSFNNWAKGQMNYLLGANPANTNFLIGMESNSAKYAHHRAASGYANYDEMGKNTGYSANGHTLTGALVGGPTDQNGTYNDSVQDYTANEVALDYNAAFVGAAAGLYSVYGTGSVDASVNGVDKTSTGTVTPPAATTTTPKQTTVTTTPKVTQQQTTTQGGNNNPTTSGGYVNNLNQAVVYSNLPKDDKMFGWEWADLGVGANEKIQKVEINISTSKSKIGKWQGAFGSSTTVAPDYWTQTDDMEQTFSGNKGTITWNVDSATQAIIQTQYKGSLKFGVWWIDCDSFTVDSVVVYTDKTGTGAATTTQATTTKATTTTTKSSTTVTTTKATTTAGTPNVPSSGNGETISGVSFGKEIDLSKYKDITSIDFVFSSTPSNGSGAVVFGQWVKSQDYQMSDLKNNTLTVSVDQDYPSVTINKYYSDTDTSLVSVVVHTKGSSAQVTTTKATTTQAQPSATTTKATTTQAQPTATTPKQTTVTTTKAPQPTQTTPKTTTTQSQPIKKLPGDADLDGKISLSDVVRMSKMLSTGTSNVNCDVNGDGIFNAADLQALLEHIIRA